MDTERQLAANAINALAAYVVFLAQNGGADVAAQLDRMESKLAEIFHKEDKLQQDIQALIDEVAATKGVEESTAVAINGVIARLDAAISTGDIEAVKAARADLASGREALAAAVAAIPPETPNP